MEVLLAIFGIYAGTSLLDISIRIGCMGTRGWRWVVLLGAMGWAIFTR